VRVFQVKKISGVIILKAFVILQEHVEFSFGLDPLEPKALERLQGFPGLGCLSVFAVFLERVFNFIEFA